VAGPYLLRQMGCITTGDAPKPGAPKNPCHIGSIRLRFPPLDFFPCSALYPISKLSLFFQAHLLSGCTPIGPLSRPHLCTSQISHPTGHHFLSNHTWRDSRKGQFVMRFCVSLCTLRACRIIIANYIVLAILSL